MKSAAARPARRSLFGEILDWLLAPLLLLWPVSMGLTWLIAQNIAEAPFDAELRQLAQALAQEVSMEVAAPHGVEPRAAAVPQAPAQATPSPFDARTAQLRLRGSGSAEDVLYQVKDHRDQLVDGDAILPAPPSGRGPSPGETLLRDDHVGDVAVRVAWTLVQPSGQAPDAAWVVQVAEPLSRRSRLATDIVKAVMVPQFVMMPLAVLLVWLALARGIAPLHELQQRIRQRDSADLSPIDEHEAPEELAALIRALNELLARLDRSMSAQKQFLADAAHQLKTPLAGLRTQAELAQRELDAQPPDAAAVRRSLAHIAQSSQNAAHMVNQLLAMARVEDRTLTRQTQALNLSDLARSVVLDFLPHAWERQIDLGFDAPSAQHDAPDAEAPALWVQGNPILLRELLRNLVDNALKYSPRGGVVTVRLLADFFGRVAALQVEDNGPGIGPADRERVFEPFYRVLGSGVEGSGLGLAIVREIANAHGGTLLVEDSNPRAAAGRGCRFTLRLPLIAALG